MTTEGQNSVRRRSVLKYTGLSGAIGLAGCLGDGGSGTDALKIGLVAPFSGDYAFYGTGQRNGLEVAVEMLNSSDEVLPDTNVELIDRDSETDPEVGLEAARELVNQKNVDFLMGQSNSTVANTIRGFADGRDVVHFVTFAGGTFLTTGENCTKNTFRPSYNTQDVFGAQHGRWGVNNLGSECYILYADYSFGETVRDAATPEIEDAGGEVVGTAAKELGAQEYGGVINEILDLDPDWMIAMMVGAGQLPFFTQASQRGLEIPATTFVQTGPLGNLTAEQYENIGDIYNPAVEWYPKLDNPQNQKFLELFRDYHGEDPNDPANNGYSNALFAAAILEAAGGPDSSTDERIEAAEDLSYDSLSGEATVRACDHQAYMPMYPRVISDVAGDGAAEMDTVDDMIPGTDFSRPCDEIGCQME